MADRPPHEDLSLSPEPTVWTRRRFLEMVGVVGGAAAVYETMVAMGVMRTPQAYAAPLPADPAIGAGKRVIVLGAGIGGLTAALRLLQNGYEVQVLEASSRIGGRNFTVRRGSVIRQIGRTDQTCAWDAPTPKLDLYWEAGCGRIPYHHYALLNLCRELGVRLENCIMESRANRFQEPSFRAGAPTVNRRIANDTRGYVSQLLAKAINQGALDQELSPAEKADLLDLLPSFGKVDPAQGFAYNGSNRLGYTVPPGVTTPGKIEERIPRAELLASKFWKHRFYQPEDFEWQTSLLEPVGGMGKIVDVLAAAVGAGKIRRGAVVRRISQSASSVTLQLADGTSVVGNACISTIPFPLLSPMLDTASFGADYRAAVATPKTANTCKVGWQAESRFWEDPNADQIFGGISWINHPITQFWYPSSGYFAKKGTLTGTYNYDSATKSVARDFGNLSLSARLDLAFEGATRLHPNFAKHVKKELGLSIAWQMVPHLEGGWADWKDDQAHREAYRRLLAPDRNFSVCGDQLSYLPGWQEGAILAAEHAVRNLLPLPKALAAPSIERAPSAASVTGAE